MKQKMTKLFLLACGIYTDDQHDRMRKSWLRITN